MLFNFSQRFPCAPLQRGIQQGNACLQAFSESINGKKPLRTYKPGSVAEVYPAFAKQAPALCHLSGTAVTDSLHLPTRSSKPYCSKQHRLPGRATRGASKSANTSTRPIRIYMAFQPARFARADRCRSVPCALTARFHPYRSKLRRLFSVALAVEPASRFPHPLGGAALYVARTFLR